MVVNLGKYCFLPIAETIVKFEARKYTVYEPIQKSKLSEVIIPVLRTGDLSRVSHIRLYTKDGSAKAGFDYQPLARVRVFTEHMMGSETIELDS